MFGFEKIEHATYKRNFLKSTTFQIMYPACPSFEGNKAKIKELFISKFPESVVIAGTSIKIEFDEKSRTPVISPAKENAGISLKTNDGERVLNISNSVFSLNVGGGSYTNFTNLLADLAVLPQFFELCGINELTRIAVRKINVLEFKTDDPNGVGTPIDVLSSLINRNLMGDVSYFPNQDKVNHNMHSLHYSNADSYLNIKYGLNIVPNNNIAQIIIDIDRFDLSSIEPEQFLDRAKLINQEIFNTFHWIISDEMLNLLK